MQNTITKTQLQHMVNFLTHWANYKVEIFDSEFENYWETDTCEEILDNAKKLITMFYDNTITYEKAMQCVTNYRYDDDCVNEGVSEMWHDYCKRNNILDFYFLDKEAHAYDGEDACMRM